MPNYVEAMRFPLITHIGLKPTERSIAQTLRASIQAYFEPQSVYLSDNLNDTVDYAALINIAQRVAQKKPRYMLERLAFDIAQALFDDQPRVERIIIDLEKFSMSEFPASFIFKGAFDRKGINPKSAI